MIIGLIREGKMPADNRVALTPAQCKWLGRQGVQVIAQPSPHRCFSDREYVQAGIELNEDLSRCDVLFGIKEVPINMLIPGKTYLFFSHTRKKQPYNQAMFRAMIDQQITLIDYESMEHADGQRIIGFGFFAGIVGAHNGMMAYGRRTGKFMLDRVFRVKDYRALIHTYFGLHLSPVKITVTGSGRVAHGILEVMNLMDVQEVDPEEYLSRRFAYPVYVHLKGNGLYQQKNGGSYSRDDFHHHPERYESIFPQYLPHTDILMNGVYWDAGIPRLFEWDAMAENEFAIQTIADITDDLQGSIPCNLGDGSKEEPVYGVDKLQGIKTAPYLPGSVDVMAVGNLPNELPRDASRYFGEQLIKHILSEIEKPGSEVISCATMLSKGKLTAPFQYLHDYAGV